jgi:hypothetical protein
LEVTPFEGVVVRLGAGEAQTIASPCAPRNAGGRKHCLFARHLAQQHECDPARGYGGETERAKETRLFLELRSAPAATFDLFHGSGKISMLRRKSTATVGMAGELR